MFLEVLVDPELAVVLLPILTVRSLDVRLALEHHDERADADLEIGQVDKFISMIDPSHPILSYPILSYPILSYPILSYPILFYPILSYPILSYPILSYPNLTKTQRLLTHDCNCHRIRYFISLHIASFASITSSLSSGHLLKNQTLIGNDDSVVLIVNHCFTLKKKKCKILIVNNSFTCKESNTFWRKRKRQTDTERQKKDRDRQR